MRQKLFDMLSRRRESRGWLFGCCLFGLVACGGAGPGHPQSRTQTPDAVEKRESVSAHPKVIKTEKVSKREDPPVEERTEFERELYEDPGFLKVEEIRPVECWQIERDYNSAGGKEFELVVDWLISEKLSLILGRSEEESRWVLRHYSYEYMDLNDPSVVGGSIVASGPGVKETWEKDQRIPLQVLMWLPETAEQLEVRLRFSASVYPESEQKEVEKKQYLRILVEPERCREWVQ